ncbi:hypothetical protein T484DRAFT_1770179 [Baffinella frigidus]|nr:hypothetical protein T484DRAFT_1770179 [Cryptophyta sp. CCMP2293]
MASGTMSQATAALGVDGMASGTMSQVMGAVMKRGTEPMLVMECMDHGSLYDLLHNETVELDAEVSMPILRDIAQGIRFLHAAQPCFVELDAEVSMPILRDIAQGIRFLHAAQPCFVELDAEVTPKA